MRLLLGAVVLMSCKFQYSGKLGGGSRSSPPAPAPTEAAAEVPAPSKTDAPSKTSAGPSKRGPVEDEMQVSELAVAPVGVPATTALDGQYLIWPDSGCGDATVKLTGPDTQVVQITSPTRMSGFVCPATCDHPMPVTVKNGKASLVLAWQDNQSVDRGYKVTIERMRVEVPLYKVPPEPNVKREAVRGGLRIKMPPHSWEDNTFTKHVSNMFIVGIALQRTDDEINGHGRSGSLVVNTGHDDKYFYDETNPAPNCMATFGQKGYLFPKVVDDGGEDDPSPSTSSGDRSARRDEQRAARAKSKCRAQCKRDAGECRKSGGGAKAANACNKAERSCDSSC